MKQFLFRGHTAGWKLKLLFEIFKKNFLKNYKNYTSKFCKSTIFLTRRIFSACNKPRVIFNSVARLPHLFAFISLGSACMNRQCKRSRCRRKDLGGCGQIENRVLVFHKFCGVQRREYPSLGEEFRPQHRRQVSGAHVFILSIF